MRILLLGEYSHVHWTLAEGLRSLGHEVTVASDGDGWKNYPRDIDLNRPSLSKADTLRYLCRCIQQFRRFRNYDVVQLINPVFLNLKADKIMPFYRYLRKHNRALFLGAFGMDHYWVKAGLDCHTFRYSDFNIGDQLRQNAYNETVITDWLHGDKGKLNRYIAEDCDGIISGLYEYDASYRPYFADKMRFIPFPINRSKVSPTTPSTDGKIRFFIGIQQKRNAYKGTDIMLRALERAAKEYPDRCHIVRVESVPFEEYQRLMNASDVLLDQLYSYTPAMNALLAMAKGLVVVGGGEPENYVILGETELRPIVNTQPNEQSVYEALRHLLEHPQLLPDLMRQSVEYIRRHHDYIHVAEQYVDFWQSRMTPH